MTSEIIRKVKNEITGLKNVTEFKSLKMPVYIYFIHTIWVQDKLFECGNMND